MHRPKRYRMGRICIWHSSLMHPQTELPVFSYGALARPEFQRSLFNELVAVEPARVRGFRLERVPIPAEELLPTDREPFRSVAVPAVDQDSAVDGFVVRLSPTQIKLADEFEAPEYQRGVVVLEDGSRAWMYLPSDG